MCMIDIEKYMYYSPTLRDFRNTTASLWLVVVYKVAAVTHAHLHNNMLMCYKMSKKADTKFDRIK